MAKTRKRLKITPVLVALNILVLFIIVIFYITRLIIYYNKEHNTVDESNLIVDSIIKKRSYVDTNNGLVYDDDTKTYTFKGNTNDNYLEYSGILFRILSVDKDNKIKAVSDSSLTIMYGNLKNGFSLSNINTWLNKSAIKNSGIFENNLFNSDSLLINTSMCDDKIDNLTKITCDKANEKHKIGILSLYDYYVSGGKESFLNIKDSYFLSTVDNNNSNYYVTSSGEIALDNTNRKALGVRAVITFSGSSEIISGNGTKENPYKIESHDIKKLSDVYVGSFVKYSNTSFKVIGIENGKVKIAQSEAIKENGKIVAKKFGSDNTYSLNKDNVGYYLNNNYYKTLKNNKYIVKSSWPVGELNTETLSYLDAYKTVLNANVGMLSLGDMYINDVKNVFLLSKGIGDNKSIDVISTEGNFYGDLVTSTYNLRPCLYLKSSLDILSGDGSEKSPFVLGENNG